MDGHYINLHCKKSSLPFKDPFFFWGGHHHFIYLFWKHGPTTKLLKQSDWLESIRQTNQKKKKNSIVKEANSHSTSPRNISRIVISVLKLIFTNKYPYQKFCFGNWFCFGINNMNLHKIKHEHQVIQPPIPVVLRQENLEQKKINKE